MFTGLIQDIGTVRVLEQSDAGWRIGIDTNLNLEEVQIGASVACSGCCLTVIEKQKNTFFVEVSNESLTKTIIKNWAIGSRVNLEPSLRLGDEIGGHLVSGHVDGTAPLVEMAQDGDSYRLTIEAPDALASFIAPKGSVALDGISLTVNEVGGKRFGVNIIPHTWAHTTLSDRKVGDALNLEVDMLARYVARQIQREAV